MYINCIFQGVVTYMFRVEAFATGIKIECQCSMSMYQAIKALLGGRSRDQGDLQTAKNQRSRTRGSNVTFNPENQAIKSLRREQSSDQAHFLPTKKLDRSHKRFYRWHISDYPLYFTVPYSVYILCTHTHTQPPVMSRTSWVVWVWVCTIKMSLKLVCYSRLTGRSPKEALSSSESFWWRNTAVSNMRLGELSVASQLASA